MSLNLGFSKTATLIIVGVIVFVLGMLYVLWQNGALPGGDPRDVRRLKDMRVILSGLEAYGRDHRGIFPESLDVLVKEKYIPKPLTDPVTGLPYKYVFDSENNYSVCTYFHDNSQQCLFTSAKKLGY